MLNKFSLIFLFLFSIFTFLTLPAFAQKPDSIPFDTAVSYPVGDSPVSIFCADLDSNPGLDLAVANGLSDSVSILKNNGDGTFQYDNTYATGDYAVSVFCADLDGDGDLDLAVTNADDYNLSILENDGNGNFLSRVNYEVGSRPYTLFCADLDGDGDLDLATANWYGNNVSVLRNLTQITGNSPPYPFHLLSPADEDTTSSIVEFHWAKTQDVNLSDQIRYDLYIIHTSFGASPATDTIIHSDLVRCVYTATLDSVGRYSWKVMAKDNWGVGTWSNETDWSFYVYLCGDCNGDGVVNTTDVVYLINYLFIDGPPPMLWKAGDCNGDGTINVSDVVYLINYLFIGGPPPSC